MQVLGDCQSKKPNFEHSVGKKEVIVDSWSSTWSQKKLENTFTLIINWEIYAGLRPSFQNFSVAHTVIVSLYALSCGTQEVLMFLQLHGFNFIAVLTQYNDERVCAGCPGQIGSSLFLVTAFSLSCSNKVDSSSFQFWNGLSIVRFPLTTKTFFCYCGSIFLV